MPLAPESEGAGESAGVDAAGVCVADLLLPWWLAAFFGPLYNAPWYFSASEMQDVCDL